MAKNSFLVEVTFKGYLRYETIFCHKVAFDVELMNFFIWKENDVSF